MTRTLLAFALWFVLGTALVTPCLRWPMVFDDLHLIRTYSGEELRSAWTGHWDPDKIETPGLRPLSPLFNHVRAALFGEGVAAHRLFLVALFALDLALLVPLATRVGLPFGSALLAGAVMLTTRYSVYHDVWITDGNHLVQGLAVLTSALLLADGLTRRSPVRLGGSLLAFAVALLVREDTMAAVPALALIGAWTAPRDARGRLAAWAVAACALSAGLLVWRRLAVPEAEGPRLDVAGFARAVIRVINPVGWESYDRASAVFSKGWAVVLVLTVAVLVVRRNDRMARLSMLWLAAAVAACAPALVLQRDDLFFFPSLFVALFLATGWTTAWTAVPSLRPLVAFGALSTLLGGAWMGSVFAQNFHPLSARAVDWNTEMLYGRYAAARIPLVRRASVAERLMRLGIRPGEEPRQRVRELVGEAKAAGRRRPEGDGRVFFPRLPELFF